ncbi:lipopolysaccharide biosynthesis protein [Clostridium fungisolvens]|uniref:Lipid II flippase MurJ n=1 Tax=Clostridium fungisolvens TaxID=1604897 RepID=A0A6V8SGE7_9CLOT|nr:oligosaccharide flippase family protein [Clostridium fungisolvens]GFP74218.1 lipid II flippase MurJ [Clostridium fungisolvens]
MLKKIIKEAGIYFVGSIGIAIISFVLSLLYSRIFSTSDFGYYSLVINVYNLVTTFLTGWMTHSIVRFYNDYKAKNELKFFSGTLFILHIFVSIVVFVVFFLIGMFLKNDLFRDIIWILSINYLFDGLLLIINGFFRADGKSSDYSKSIFLNSVFKAIILLVLYYIIGRKNIDIIIVSFFIAGLIQTIYLLIKYKDYKFIKIKNFDYQIFKRSLNFGFPLIGVSLINWILSLSDRYIIKIFWPAKDVGLYSYGYQMGNALFYTLTICIMLGAYPNLAKEWETKGKASIEKLISKYLELFFYVLIPCTFAIFILGKNVIELLCGQEYWSSYKVFEITCFSYAVYGLIQYTNIPWVLVGNTKKILSLNIIAALTNIILNFLLIPKYGYIIAAINTLVAFIVYVCISLIQTKNIFAVKVESSFLLKVLISSSIMDIVLKLCVVNFRNTIINMVVTVFFGILCYFFTLVILKDKNIYLLIENRKVFRKKNYTK